MTDYKKVGTRTPEKINIDLGAIPENESDALCRADYEKWKNERKLRKEAATT